MKNRIKETLDKFSSKCDYLEIRIEEIEKLSFGIINQDITALKQNFKLGAAIRACYKGGWGFASINSIDDLERFTDIVVSQARIIGSRKTMLAEVEPVNTILSMQVKVDPREILLKDKIELFKGYNDKVRSFHTSIVHSGSSYEQTVTRKYYGNSEGTMIERPYLDVNCAVRATAMKNGISQTTYVTRGSSNDYSVVLNLDDAVEKTCQKVIQLVSAPPVKGGVYPVVVDPHLGGTFAHEAFGHFSEADDFMDNPQQIKTFPLGKKIGSTVLSIYDTGLDSGTRGYLPYDDEGVPGQKSMLLENGLLVGRLHSRESAAKLGEKPTGSARAKDYQFAPICRMRNTCIANGDTSFEELLDGIDEGVYAVSSIGGHGGEMFSFSALYGYMIRKGKIAEMVRDVSISGNLFTTLLNIDKVGNDFEIEDSSGGCGKGAQFPLPVTSSSPHFRIKEATVGGV